MPPWSPLLSDALSVPDEKGPVIALFCVLSAACRCIACRSPEPAGGESSVTLDGDDSAQVRGTFTCTRDELWPGVTCRRASHTLPLGAGPRTPGTAGAGVKPVAPAGNSGTGAGAAGASSSAPDVWHDIVGPAGFLQQFENQLFEADEKGSAEAEMMDQYEFADRDMLDDHDGEGEAGEVMQAVLEHVEERRVIQSTLQEDLRYELEETRKVRPCCISLEPKNKHARAPSRSIPHVRPA